MLQKLYCCRIAIHKCFFCVYGVGACRGDEVVVVVVVVVTAFVVVAFAIVVGTIKFRW